MHDHDVGGTTWGARRAGKVLGLGSAPACSSLKPWLRRWRALTEQALPKIVVGVAIRPDPRSPLVLDVHELGKRPGAMRELRRDIEAPADLGTEVIGISEGAVLELDLRIESVMEGVLVSGTVRGGATGECVRCLGDAGFDVDAGIQELYVYPGRAPQGQQDDELRELVDDLIDLEPALRDAVVLALPFQPVCSVDCPGLCSECGARLEDEPGHHHESVDPRWAALQGLQEVLDDEKES